MEAKKYLKKKNWNEARRMASRLALFNIRARTNTFGNRNSLLTHIPTLAHTLTLVAVLPLTLPAHATEYHSNTHTWRERRKKKC